MTTDAGADDVPRRTGAAASIAAVSLVTIIALGLIVLLTTALHLSGHLVASFEPGPERPGGVIGVYDLGPGGG